jgi:hypothetical protein
MPVAEQGASSRIGIDGRPATIHDVGGEISALRAGPREIFPSRARRLSDSRPR